MIKGIILSNFRNFSILRCKFNRINIIKGKNGVGKTNLIEAVYFSLNGHPFTRDLRSVQKDPQKPTYITSELKDHTVQIVVFENRKTLKLDGKPTKIVDLKKLFPCIDYSINSFISFKNKEYLFSLLDRGIFANNISIIERIVKYRKLQRTKRLIFKKESIDMKMLEIVNSSLVETIEYISQERKKLVDAVKGEISNCFFSFYGRDLSLDYNIKTINRNWFRDEILKKRILVSLKKDSLSIKVNDMDLFRFSSVGEKKIALLCIVLSIVKLYNNTAKEAVFLVDDLEGDLDCSTQKRAFEILEKLPNQIFVTTLGAFEGYNTIEILEDGRIEPVYS